MARFGFCGPSYTSQSPNAADERCLNLYPETIESSGGKSSVALYPTAGLQLVQTLTGPSVRSFAIFPGGVAGYAISGQKIWQFNPGTGLFGVRPVTISGADNTAMRSVAGPGGAGGGCLVFTSNGVLNVYDPVAGTLNTPGAGITATFPGPISMIEYCGGFYLALVANSSQIFASSPLDPFTWPALSFGAVSVFPDRVVNITENQNQVWVFGQQSSVVYYLSGNSPFPFDVISGSIMEQGCGAALSVQKMDNSLFWLGQDSRGYAMIWRASGYTPQRVSNHAVEFAMQGYPDVLDAIAYTFQDQGHSFYQISFPSANAGNGATWVYDAATQQWHERCFVASGVEKMHRSQNHGLFRAAGPIHLVGDPSSGNVYQMNIPKANGTVWDFADDFGNPIKRLRRSPHINIEKEWMRYDELVLDLEAGLGPIPPFLDSSSTSVGDNFNRADGGLGANWTAVLGFNTSQIVSNAVEILAPGGIDSAMVFTLSPSLTHQQASITVGTLTANGAIGVCCRMSIAGGFYLFLVTGPTGIHALGELFYIDALGNINELSNGFMTILPGDVLTLQAVGSSLTCLVNGVIIGFLSATDSHLASGFQGFFLSALVADTDAIADNFVAQNIPVARDPLVFLRWSKDGGHTFSASQQMGAGQAGDFTKRVVQRRMGRARQMLFEVSMTDPIPWRFTDAYLKATAFQPEERLAKKLAKSA